MNVRRHSSLQFAFGLALLAIAALPSPSGAEESADARLRALVQQLREEQITANNLVEALASFPSSVVAKAGRDGRIVEPTLRAYIASELVEETKETLASRTSSNAAPLRDLAVILLGRESEAALRIKRLVYLAERAEILAAARDAVRLDSLGDELRDAEEREVVERQKSRVLHRLAGENVQAGKPGVALRQLAEIEPAYWKDE
ncbi:MAG: hypothetical protein KDD44_15210, partial [Bdellovibrionales bacterium]|nr:hypothetical protein [Bdellovibrionales bacterium]